MKEGRSGMDLETRDTIGERKRERESLIEKYESLKYLLGIKSHLDLKLLYIFYYVFLKLPLFFCSTV